MGVFCDSLKLGSTAALNWQTGKHNGRYQEKELSFLFVSLVLEMSLTKISKPIQSEQKRYILILAEELLSHAHGFPFSWENDMQIFSYNSTGIPSTLSITQV